MKHIICSSSFIDVCLFPRRIAYQSIRKGPQGKISFYCALIIDQSWKRVFRTGSNKVSRRKGYQKFGKHGSKSALSMLHPNYVLRDDLVRWNLTYHAVKAFDWPFPRSLFALCSGLLIMLCLARITSLRAFRDLWVSRLTQRWSSFGAFVTSQMALYLNWRLVSTDQSGVAAFTFVSKFGLLASGQFSHHLCVRFIDLRHLGLIDVENSAHELCGVCCTACECLECLRCWMMER
jgi:hypothetical protein